ncbi:MAG: hypothetical protein HY308_15505 [Gammaproteobacteria bacterium]|nr:hypothetical protein [Gammaproteobacteria bacterium]
MEVSTWKENLLGQPKSVWASKKRTAIEMSAAIGQHRSLTAVVQRRRVPIVGGSVKQTLDVREHDICKRVVDRISEVLRPSTSDNSAASLQAIRDSFDEQVVAHHVAQHHNLTLSISAVFDALHTLSEQSYENKSLTFGCILDPSHREKNVGAKFPKDFIDTKKYKALSDGFRSAYHVSSDGRIINFVDLDRFNEKSLTEKHYYPDWAEPIARASRYGKCGVALSRQGDILVFDKGTLRFTYRYGRWQYWNHAHLLSLLKDRARAQRVPATIRGRVVGAIYRAVLDVSFRRSGGLFVILHNRNNLRDIVRTGDAIGSESKRSQTDREFDAVLIDHSIQSLARPVVVELASLDGAIVLDNSGKILAYGAVLQPKKSGRLSGTEGSDWRLKLRSSDKDKC